MDMVEQSWGAEGGRHRHVASRHGDPADRASRPVALPSPPGDTWRCLRHGWLSQLWGLKRHLLGRGRGAARARHPVTRGTAPRQRTAWFPRQWS